jgi:hypothetical protein
MNIWKFFLLLLYSLFKPELNCNHSRVNPFLVNGNYCPDCGKEVIVEWAFLKCQHCNSVRSGLYLHQRFLPVERFCNRCGHSHYRIELKQKLEVYDADFAAYKVRPADVFPRKRSQTTVWLEPETLTSDFEVITVQPNTFFFPVTVSS